MPLARKQKDFRPEKDDSLMTCSQCGYQQRQKEEKFCPKCGKKFSQNEDAFIGRVIDSRYRITRLIGAGGMGVVYQVDHIIMGKIMAMKLLHSNVSNKQNAIIRFRREIAIVSKLNNLHTIQVFDTGVTKDGYLYVVMEYLRGLDLEKVLEIEGVLSCLRAAKIARQVCSSLAEAHQHGIIHRDIKPANIVLLRDQGEMDFVKLLDFGIAKLSEGDAFTETGVIIGTPYYMAPEQITNAKSITPSVDIYSLGIVLFEMITGQLPFSANSAEEFLLAHVNVIPPLPSSISDIQPIDTELEQIIMRALAKDPQKRFASIREMEQALNTYITRNSTPISPTTTLAHTNNIESPSLPSQPNHAKNTATFERDPSLLPITPSPSTLTQSQPNIPQGELVRYQNSPVPYNLKNSREFHSRQAQTSGWQRVAIEEEPIPEQLASREDWDLEERRWRRKKYMRIIIPTLLFIFLIGWISFYIWNAVQHSLHSQKKLRLPQITEREPNNTINKATLIKTNHWITGILGQKLSNSSSDLDWLRFNIPKNNKKTFSIRLIPPKGLNVELGLYQLILTRQGNQLHYSQKELLSINNRFRGGEEHLLNYLPRNAQTYYILIRELLVPGERPQENLGTYRLKISFHPIRKNYEIEPNDTFTQAQPIKGNLRFFGFHDRKHDIDFYRISLPKKRRFRRRYAHLKFNCVGRHQPNLLLLDPNGHPLRIRKKHRIIRKRFTIPCQHKRSRRRKRRCYRKKRIHQILITFPRKNTFILKIQAQDFFNDTIPYNFIIR